MAQRQKVDAGAEYEAAARNGRLRNHEKRIEERDGEGDVVAEPDLVESLRVRVRHEGHQFVYRRQPGPRHEIPPPVDRLDAELQRPLQYKAHARFSHRPSQTVYKEGTVTEGRGPCSYQ